MQTPRRHFEKVIRYAGSITYEAVENVLEWQFSIFAARLDVLRDGAEASMMGERPRARLTDHYRKGGGTWYRGI